jgi:hypothetical protein
MKHRLSFWKRRRDADGSTTGVRLEVDGTLAIVVVAIALILAAAVAICVFLREAPLDRPASRLELQASRECGSRRMHPPRSSNELSSPTSLRQA